MYGGTITSTSSKKSTIGIQAGRTLKLLAEKSQILLSAGIYGLDTTNVSATIGNVTFENNDNDIALVLNSEKKLIIQDDFKGTASVYQLYLVEYPYIITMPGTSPEMRNKDYL